MGNYNCRKPGFMAAWEIAVAEYVFQGKDDEEIIETLWHLKSFKYPPEEYKKKHRNYKNRLTKLKKTPKFQEYYKSIVTEWTVHNAGRAIRRLADQIDDPDKWLSNKAANDVLARGLKLMDALDENTVTVKIEGMPVIGSPED